MFCLLNGLDSASIRMQWFTVSFIVECSLPLGTISFQQSPPNSKQADKVYTAHNAKTLGASSNISHIYLSGSAKHRKRVSATPEKGPPFGTEEGGSACGELKTIGNL